MSHPAKEREDGERALLRARIAQAGPRDWPEDFQHENGNYWCTCLTCGERFTGHKRRITCKVCALIAQHEADNE